MSTTIQAPPSSTYQPTTASTTRGTTQPDISTTTPSPTTLSNIITIEALPDTTELVTTIIPPTNSTNRAEIGTTASSANVMVPVVGSSIGAAVLLAVLVIVLVWIVRRHHKKKASKKTVSELPGKEYLDRLHMQQAVVCHHMEPQAPEMQVPSGGVKHYANITATGEMDEQTDPSVGHDGYLKKKSNMFGHIEGQKKKENNRHRGTRQREDNDAVTQAYEERPIYGNEVDSNEKGTKRTHFMPYGHAPSPPNNNKTSADSTYTEGRIGKNAEANTAESDEEEVNGYVNMPPQKKGEPGSNVAPKKHLKQKNKAKHTGQKNNRETDKMYVNDQEDVARPSDSSDMEQRKVYENLDDGKYYNLIKGGKQCKIPGDVNDEVLSQDMYEIVDRGKHSIGDLEQDDLYEET